jgi:hypothetical protein
MNAIDMTENIFAGNELDGSSIILQINKRNDWQQA